MPLKPDSQFAPDLANAQEKDRVHARLMSDYSTEQRRADRLEAEVTRLRTALHAIVADSVWLIGAPHEKGTPCLGCAGKISTAETALVADQLP